MSRSGIDVVETSIAPEDADNGREGGVRAGSLRSRIENLLVNTFLPSSYPSSVSEGYIDHVKWQAMNSTTTAATTVLSSSFLLYAVGLGAGAIPVSGAINWVLKDGLGSIGTLVFSNSVAHTFDRSCKSWFVLAALLLNCATCVEICTYAYPSHFLLLGAGANAIKGISFMATSSTRAAFNLTFAKTGNIADVTAKATAQGILFHTLGSCLGMAVCALIEQDTSLALGCLAGLSAANLYAAWRSTQFVPIARLTPERIQELVDTFPEIPTPLEMARRESLSIPRVGRRARGGTRADLASSMEAGRLYRALRAHENENHFVCLCYEGAPLLVLHERCGESRDLLRARVHFALVARKRVAAGASGGAGDGGGGLSEEEEEEDGGCVLEALRETGAIVESMGEAGWDVDGVCAEPDARRAAW